LREKSISYCKGKTNRFVKKNAGNIPAPPRGIIRWGGRKKTDLLKGRNIRGRKEVLIVDGKDLTRAEGDE